MKKITPLLVAVILVAGGLTSVWLGRDVNPDLGNYHYYNPYALFHGRLGVDIAPAGIQTFFNPLLDIPFYVFVKIFSARWVGFFMGAIHSVNLILLYFLAKETLRDHFRQKSVRFYSALLALLGLFGPISVMEHGTTLNDNFVSLFVYLALLLLLVGLRHSKRFLFLAISGALIGFALGLKGTVYPYVFVLALLLLFTGGGYRQTLKAVMVWGLGALLGFAISDGFWALMLWQKFGNPFFPLFNSIFKSTYYAAKEIQPAVTWQGIFLEPVNLLFANENGTKWQFRDPRWLAFGLLGIYYLVWRAAALFKTRGRSPWKKLSPSGIILLFVALSFFWMLHDFWVFRYLHTLEGLLPLAIFLLIKLIVNNQRTGLIIASVLTILISLFITYPKNQRADWVEGDYFGVEIDTPVDSGPVLVLVGAIGLNAMSYVIPYFDPSYRFIRLESIMTRPSDGGRLQADAINSINAHRGKFLSLVVYPAKGNDFFKPYGFRFIEKKCSPIKQKFRGTLYLCPLEKINVE